MDNKTLHTLVLTALLLAITACKGDPTIGASACTIHGESPASKPPGTGTGDKTLTLSWQAPTQREDQSVLPPRDIQGYLIVTVPKSDEHKFYDQMSKIDPVNYQQVPSGDGLFLPPGSIPALAASESSYAVLVSCSGKTEFVIENTEPNVYYFAISTVAMGGKIGDIKKYSQASRTVSINTP